MIRLGLISSRPIGGHDLSDMCLAGAKFPGKQLNNICVVMAIVHSSF